MKQLVVYDSAFGNTKAIARAIGDALGDTAQIVWAVGTDVSVFDGADLVVVGSPTQGGRPTSAIARLLDELPEGALAGLQTAAFDTRFAPETQGIGIRFLMRLIGYAAPRIARQLRSKGGSALVEPEGFIVEKKDGPLKQGELERAARWAAALSPRPSVTPR